MATTPRTQVLHVVGARPNFPKAAPVMEALDELGVTQKLVHTGQHYDDAMSASFFKDLQIPQPDVNLSVGSGSHAQQTARIMTAFEPVLLEMNPELVVVYGDVNSTIAAALVAVKLGYPVAHVEAGLRSFDMTMPEEINRKLTDQISELLFTTSPEAEANLMREGVDPNRIHFVGNPMIDTLLKVLPLTEERPVIPGVDLPSEYAVLTLHRPSNVDSIADVEALVSKIHECGDLIPIIAPLHPRARPAFADAGFENHSNCILVSPLEYLPFVSLMRHASVVITDSGGIQEETTMLGVSCLTLRRNTERPVTIERGTNLLVDIDSLVDGVRTVVGSGNQYHPRSHVGPERWDGAAGKRIGCTLATFLTRTKAKS